MKANEVPEKLYISDSELNDAEHCVIWFKSQQNENDIEYIRKDAFIEKACDFFEENIKEEDCKIGSSEWTELRAEYKSLDSFIRAFIGYMKGE